MHITRKWRTSLRAHCTLQYMIQIGIKLNPRGLTRHARNVLRAGRVPPAPGLSLPLGLPIMAFQQAAGAASAAGAAGAAGHGAGSVAHMGQITLQRCA